MKIGITLSSLLLGSAAALIGQMSADALPDGDGAAGGIGADVAVCNMPSIYRWGTVSGVTAYSVATTSVNLGDENLTWYANNNQHPRIPQNLFRFYDGRLEQLGMSWCKDGFCALQLNECAACQPAGSGCPQLLGPGCSDPYSDSLNGQQSNLAPRWQCNAATGWFQYPPQNLPGAAPTVGRRLQVLQADLAVSGATFYCDSFYLHPQDYNDGNSLNNASFKRVNRGTLSGSGYALSPTGATTIGKPAIFAWQNHSSTVSIEAVDIPNDGRVYVASDVVDNGDGTFRYDYAIYNLTSDYCVNGFAIPVPAGLDVTNIEFRDVSNDSGGPYSTATWTSGVVDGHVVWNTEEYAENPDANAIRWATMYNFSFTVNAEPAAGDAELEIFRTNSTAAAPVAVPGGPTNPYDLNGDGCVDGVDSGIFLTQWGVPNSFCDFNQDGQTNAADQGLLFAAWGCNG